MTSAERQGEWTRQLLGEGTSSRTEAAEIFHEFILHDVVAQASPTYKEDILKVIDSYLSQQDKDQIRSQHDAQEKHCFEV